MDFVRMNLFQRLTRQWNNLHPYIAAQVMRIRTPATALAITRSWKAALLGLELGQVEIRGQKYRHSARPLPVTFLPPGSDLDRFLSQEMNRGFDLLAEGPFRACVVPDRDTTALAIVYDHWLADSVSIRLLMREWFLHLVGEEYRKRPITPLQQQVEHDGEVELPFSLASLAEWREGGRHVRRLPEESLDDLSVSHRMIRLPDCSAAELRTAARARGVKVTDLLLCSIARVCDRHLPTLNPQRPDLALGSIRDLRPTHWKDDPDAFGSMLAISMLICRHDALADRNLLLSQIAQKNEQLRQPQTFKARNVDKRVGLAAAHILKSEKMLRFYSRRLPLAAGLSNVNLSNTWVAQYADHIAEYYRVSPTGPMLPLVVTPTTLNDKVNISLTWRRSVFTEASVTAFASDLLEEIRGWMQQRQSAVAYEPAA